jgi:hypothetical protein
MFGCVSISQRSLSYLEPPPIPKVEARIRQLQQFKQIGAVSVLALRPFLPNVPIEDYERILGLAQGKIDVVLGGDWYVDREGVLESRVLQGSPSIEGAVRSLEPMPFDGNDETWRVYKMPQIEEFVRERAKDMGVPFFMRSRPAIEYIRGA